MPAGVVAQRKEAGVVRGDRDLEGEGPATVGGLASGEDESAAELLERLLLQLSLGLVRVRERLRRHAALSGQLAGGGRQGGAVQVVQPEFPFRGMNQLAQAGPLHG